MPIYRLLILQTQIERLTLISAAHKLASYLRNLQLICTGKYLPYIVGPDSRPITYHVPSD
jgi:hypothetical protein